MIFILFLFMGLGCYIIGFFMGRTTYVPKKTNGHVELIDNQLKLVIEELPSKNETYIVLEWNIKEFVKED